MNDIEYLNNERKKANKRIQNIIEVLSIIEKHSDRSIKDWCNTIIDCESNPDIVDTAKYINYWLEKTDTIDDPEITKYNDFKEGK